MKIIFTTVGVSVVWLALWPISAHALKWVPAAGQSCVRVCVSADSSPVVSGIYKNGNPFYVCRGNAQDEGERAGYNVEPSWSNACTVGWGGKELPVTPYECLCNP
jgi:hypothetical protein